MLKLWPPLRAQYGKEIGVFDKVKFFAKTVQMY